MSLFINTPTSVSRTPPHLHPSLLPAPLLFPAANNQKWTWLPDMRLHSWDANLCLQACGTNGCTSITLATCASSDAQRWLYDNMQRLRPLNAATLCLQWSGTALVLSNTCSGTAPFMWGVTGALACVRWCCLYAPALPRRVKAAWQMKHTAHGNMA
jgi:hypothetical protein